MEILDVWNLGRMLLATSASDAGVRREQAALSHIHYIILCTQALVYN